MDVYISNAANKDNVKIGNYNFYLNGKDNLYPYKVEQYIEDSPTASRCMHVMADFIAGSIDPGQDLKVNKNKEYYLSDIIMLMSQSIAKFRGFYLHIFYELQQDNTVAVANLDVLDFKKCRVSKPDDYGYNGKIIYHDWLTFNPWNKQEFKTFYPFNMDYRVIRSQMIHDFKQANPTKQEYSLLELNKSYTGQVLYVNLDPTKHYPLAYIHSALRDAESEKLFSVYTNEQFARGFLGKIIPVIGNMQEDQKQELKNKLQEGMGACEVASNMVFFTDHSTESIDSIVKFIQLPPQFDDKLFVSNDRRIKSNIMGTFKSIPEPLVMSNDGSLFGVNAQTYNNMVSFYNNQTAYERNKIQNTLNKIGYTITVNPKQY